MQKLFFLTLLIAGQVQATELVLNFASLPQYVFQNNVKVLLAQLDYDLAVEEKQAAEGKDDINLSFASFWNREHVKQNSNLDKDSLRETTSSWSLGFTKSWGSGLEAEASFQSLRVFSDSNRVILRKRYQTAGQIKLTKSILKGSSFASTRTEQAKASPKIKRYRARLEKAFQKELTKARKLYIDLWETRRKIAIRQKTLDHYADLQRYVLRAVKLGQKGLIDKMNILAQVERERALVLKDQGKVYGIQHQLRKRIHPLESTNTQYINYQANLQSELPSTDILRQHFFHHRLSEKHPELRDLKQQWHEAEIDLEAAKDTALPQLDLSFEVLYSGLSGNHTEPYHHIQDGKFPSYEVVLTFSWPLGDRAGKGGVIAARQKLTGLGYQLASKRRSLEDKLSEQDRKTRQLIQSYQGIRSRIQDQEKLLQIKQKMFKYGRLSFLDFSDVVRETEDLKLEQERLRAQIWRLYADLVGQLGIDPLPALTQ